MNPPEKHTVLPGNKALVLPAAATPMQVIAQAVANGAPVETMEKLLACLSA